MCSLIIDHNLESDYTVYITSSKMVYMGQTQSKALSPQGRVLGPVHTSKRLASPDKSDMTFEVV